MAHFIFISGGYLHQFSLDDKVSPEKTIYIPNTTIIPSIDLNHLNTVMTEYAGDTSNTFEICKPATNVLQRDKVSVFRTSTREELVTWCRMLVYIASGVSLSYLDQNTTEDDLVLRSSPISFDELEHKPSTVQVMRLNHSNNMDTKKINDSTSTVSSSPTRSLRSVRTEESFNEPAAYNKSSSAPPPTTTSFALSTPISDIIVEEELYNSTDAESFVTARIEYDNDHYSEEETSNDIEQDAGVLVEYFNSQLKNNISVSDDSSDDALSVASASTAKGHSKTSDSPNTNERSPSLISTSDAQSSLYFSSTSAPPSPSGLSDNSSVVSIPEFQLLPQVISITQNLEVDTR